MFFTKMFLAIEARIDSAAMVAAQKVYDRCEGQNDRVSQYLVREINEIKEEMKDACAPATVVATQEETVILPREKKFTHIVLRKLLSKINAAGSYMNVSMQEFASSKMGRTVSTIGERVCISLIVGWIVAKVTSLRSFVVISR
jgi:hypothetical protein